MKQLNTQPVIVKSVWPNSNWKLTDINRNGSFQTVVKTNYTRDVTVFTLSGGTTSNPSNDERLRYPVTKVADDEMISGLCIFDSSFPLMPLKTQNISTQ